MYIMKTIEEFISVIKELRTNKRGEKSSPHKLLLLLAVCNMLEKEENMENKFLFDDFLLSEFKVISKKYFSDSEIYIEYPYYHLASSILWDHQLKVGLENRYKSYKRFTPKRIKETIGYSCLNVELYRLLKDKKIETD
ncbi:hypothetical protein D1AOALGA4SA_6722 [Olavius algarvensis Delta 1 endosymbiont]|nr:hypothetical protein D1AOALGA4SA_6722 [Olavius algarvensis Delta 1 endosymbiont]